MQPFEFNFSFYDLVSEFVSVNKNRNKYVEKSLELEKQNKKTIEKVISCVYLNDKKWYAFSERHKFLCAEMNSGTHELCAVRA